MNANDTRDRAEVVGLVPENAVKILDVGCGFGDVGLALKKRRDCEVTGLEIDSERAEAAKSKLDKVLMENIEKNELLLQEDYFDCIIFADVLEHMREPLDVLKNFKRYLKSGGCIVVSIPNVRHVTVIKDLVLNGKWEYADFGIMDRGHLRFFTRKSIEDMFRAVELQITFMDRIFSIKGTKYINALTFGLFKEFLTMQYVCRLEKK